VQVVYFSFDNLSRTSYVNDRVTVFSASHLSITLRQLNLDNLKGQRFVESHGVEPHSLAPRLPRFLFAVKSCKKAIPQYKYFNYVYSEERTCAEWLCQWT
jgi:hypothetical protein